VACSPPPRNRRRWRAEMSSTRERNVYHVTGYHLALGFKMTWRALSISPFSDRAHTALRAIPMDSEITIMRRCRRSTSQSQSSLGRLRKNRATEIIVFHCRAQRTPPLPSAASAPPGRRQSCATHTRSFARACSPALSRSRRRNIKTARFCTSGVGFPLGCESTRVPSAESPLAPPRSRERQYQNSTLLYVRRGVPARL